MIPETTPVPCTIEPTDGSMPPTPTFTIFCRACNQGYRDRLTIEVGDWDIEVNPEDLIAAINKARGQ